MRNLTEKKQRFCFLVIVILITVFVFFDTLPVFGQLNELEKTAELANIKGEKDLSVVIGRMVGIVLGSMGVIFTVLLIIGGFMWMTSRGNEDAVKRARDLIRNAIIGLAIVVIAYALAHFITEEFAKAVK